MHGPARAAAAIPLALWLTFSCGAPDDGFDAETAPYGELTLATQNAYEQEAPSGPEENLSRVLGEKILGGRRFDRYHVGLVDSDPDTEGAEFWASHDGETIDLAGFVARGDSWIFPGSAGLTVEFETPVRWDLHPPVGEPQAFETTAVGTIDGDPTTYTGAVSGTYTLVSEDAAVETAAGTVTGCGHYVATLRPTADVLSGVLDDVTLDAELWHHSSFGIVAATLPAVGWSMGLEETMDCDTGSSGFRTIRKMAVLDANAPAFALDTYACSGSFDADKNTHARMLLELRWLDPAMARSAVPPAYPGVTLDFGTVFGSYVAHLVESPVSIFHPEENAEGYTYWIAYVDQAARNEPDNGIAYHVRVDIDPDLVGPLRATARIHYRVFDE